MAGGVLGHSPDITNIVGADAVIKDIGTARETVAKYDGWLGVFKRFDDGRKVVCRKACAAYKRTIHMGDSKDVGRIAAFD